MIVQEFEGVQKFTVVGPPSQAAIGLQCVLLLSAALSYYLGYNIYISFLVLLSPLAVRIRKQESLMEVKDVGIQIDRWGFFCVLDDHQTFLPAHKIVNVVINEVFIGWQVQHALQILVKDRDRVVLGFENVTPRLPELEQIWRALQAGPHH